MKIVIGAALLLSNSVLACGGDSSGNDVADVADVVDATDDAAGGDADADGDGDADSDADADADADAEEEATPDAEPDGETGDAASACVRSAGVSACGEVVVGGSLAPCTTAGLVENGVRSAGAGSCRR